MAEPLSEFDARWQLGELMRAGWKMEMQATPNATDVLIVFTAPFEVNVFGEQMALRIAEPANVWTLWLDLISAIHAAHAVAFPVPKDGTDQAGEIPPREL